MNQEIFARSIAFWGEERQKKIFQSTLLVAGVGGLGCVVAEILVRAGIGCLILIDAKKVDTTDLNRQTLYTESDLGRWKVDAASEKLASRYNGVKIVPINIALKPGWVSDKASGCTPDGKLAGYMLDGVADCLDNYQSRFALEEILTSNIFLVHGGVRDDYGQITTIIKGKSLSLREIYHSLPDSSSPIPVCPQIVFTIGSLMANEIIKNLWAEPGLLNTILVAELSDYTFSKISLSPSD